MRYILLIPILFLFVFFSSAQNTETIKIEDLGITPSYKNSNDGTIIITQDANLRKAIKRHIEINDNKFKGWRVQVYFNSGQRAMGEAQSVKKRFLTRYGNKYGAYIVYDSPNFKVQVGDFRSKAEALHFMNYISNTFPNSWIVKVKVNYPVEFSE